MNVDDIPVLSGARWLGHLRELDHDRLGLLRRFGRECGAIGRLRVAFASIVLVNAPEPIHEVLIEKARSFRKPPAIIAPTRAFLRQGLAMSEGELWQRERRLMAPLFTQGEVAHYADCMAACASSAALELREGQVVDVAEEMRRITLRVAGKVFFDVDVLDGADELGQALTLALRWVDEATGKLPWAVRPRVAYVLEAVAPWLPEPLRGPTSALARAVVDPVRKDGRGRVAPAAPRRAELALALATIERRVARMIVERRRVGLSRPDLLSRLLSARDEHGDALPDAQVRDEIVTLLVAGYETTAMSLAWSLYLLGRHPEALARAAAEARGLSAPLLCAGDVQRLGYCVAVFQEAMRLYPPVYLIVREAAEDVTIGGVRLPRGTLVLVSPYALHHRAELWPDPERFEPSRFAPGAEPPRHRLAFMPFGAGPRTCIGNHFALVEGPIVLATILGRVDLELVEPDRVVPETAAALRPKGGVPMRVTAVRCVAGV